MSGTDAEALKMPHISTHVLDVALGKPAAGIRVELRGNVAVTNANGRTDAPLIVADPLEPGSYEVVFHVGDYLRARGNEIPFYEAITIQFAVADGTRNYHVPLLLAPHGYSTYLGS
jgi:5-hydroxyisourate hydrolase